jgi:hypothetical protein
MTTCQAVVAVLPPAGHKTILFSGVHVFRKKNNEVQVNLETPSYLWVFTMSPYRIGACSGPGVLKKGKAALVPKYRTIYMYVYEEWR